MRYSASITAILLASWLTGCDNFLDLGWEDTPTHMLEFHIGGIVQDEAGNPIEGATVLLHWFAGWGMPGELASALSDSLGHYVLEGRSELPSTYCGLSVTASKDGFRIFSDGYEVSNGPPCTEEYVRLDIVMRQHPMEGLN